MVVLYAPQYKFGPLSFCSKANIRHTTMYFYQWRNLNFYRLTLYYQTFPKKPYGVQGQKTRNFYQSTIHYLIKIRIRSASGTSPVFQLYIIILMKKIEVYHFNYQPFKSRAQGGMQGTQPLVRFVTQKLPGENPGTWVIV